MVIFAVRHALRVVAALLWLVLTSHGAVAGRVPAGTMIGSAVQVAFEVRGVVGGLSATSNIPLILIKPNPTPSRLTLKRLSADAAQGMDIAFGQVAFADNATEESPYRIQRISGFDPSVPANLVETDSYLPGDIIFFQLRDEGLNHLPDVAEIVLITLEGANGDREVFRLEASGPDSGDFYGYALAVSPANAIPGDGQLATGANIVVEASYEDEFDTTDRADAVAVSDPRMRVFDALSGEPVDGAAIRIVDADTGTLIPVYGIDARSRIVTEIHSGARARDTSGQTYEAEPGELRVPFLKAGRYRIEVTAPSGHVFPSDTANAIIAALPGDGYRIAQGARGAAFDLPVGGTPKFDIPLDPRGAMQLTKSASTAEVTHGDFIRYGLSLDNNDDRDARDVVIADVLPFGFRFEPGSLRIDNVAAGDPLRSKDGTALSLRIGAVPSGARSTLSYIARVGAQARFGMAESTAVAQAAQGFRSNRADAVVTVRDDLLSDTGTLLGRVVIGACGEAGEGVEARLLLETGRAVTTDADGRFHIDSLGAKPHALRLDEHSLPDGLVPHACPGDLRPGDTATTRTVELRGGLLRSVIFHLRREERADVARPEKAVETAREWTEERLTELPRELDILYPVEGASMGDPSLAIGVAYPFGRRVSLVVNGEPVSNLSARKTLANRKAGLAMRRWHGIDLPDGPSRIEVTIRDAKGREVGRMERIVHYVTEPAEATVLADRSTLVADGQESPEIAIRFTDDAGRPVHAGRRIPITVSPPYQTTASFARFTDDPLIASDSTRSMAEVGEDGVALVRLRPTARAGEVEIALQFGTRDTTLRAWLAPAPRPWVLVGIADGTLGYNTISGNMVGADQAGPEDDIVTDGRVAFYAKGAIRGDWLLTLAYDSDKGRNPRERDFFDEIDPNAFYPVYGDASTREQAAPSRYPLFVRLERGQFFAMFGDYTTGMNRTELAAYERTLSGFKAVYEDDRFQVVAFAAEADQQVLRVESSATLGVGPYDLGATDILRNSEKVRLVVRAREGLSTVISETELARFVDYSIDYETGELQLQRAPSPTDDAFNPAFVVVDFETDSPDPGQITAGGRASVRLLDDAVEIGVTGIHEEGGGIDASGDLAALDIRAKIGDSVDVMAEIATSRVQEDGTERDGTAYRAEATYASEGWRAKIYVRQTGADFGVAQQSIATTGRRVQGATLNTDLADPFAAKDDPDPTRYDLTARAYRDEDLSTKARRDLGEWRITRPVTYGPYGTGEVAIGYRVTQDRTSSGETRRAHRALARVGATILNGRATVSVERKQTFASSGTGGEPDSTLIQTRMRLTSKLRATAGIETFDGESVSTANLRAGLAAEPWAGGRLSAGIDALRAGVGESADRVAATVGVAQDIKLTERLSASLRIDHTQPLAGSDSPVVDSLFSGFRSAEEATNASAGLGYGGKGWNASVRLDLRNAESGHSERIAAGAIGDITDALTLAAAGDLRHEERDSSQTGTLTVGAAYRPLHRRLMALHRLEARFDTDSDTRTTLVNTLTVEGRPTEWLTLAGSHGIRLRMQEFGDADYASVTQFIGADAYFRLTPRWSLGIHGDTLFTLDGEASYAYGASVGYSPRAGMALRLGYNLTGFEDDDFGHANTTAQGAYARLTLRFDESDIRSILPDAGWIGALTAVSAE